MKKGDKKNKGMIERREKRGMKRERGRKKQGEDTKKKKG